jgi:hypothetical protein
MINNFNIIKGKVQKDIGVIKFQILKYAKLIVGNTSGTNEIIVTNEPIDPNVYKMTTLSDLDNVYLSDWEGKTIDDISRIKIQ